MVGFKTFPKPHASHERYSTRMPFSSVCTIDEADKEIKEKRTLIWNDVMKWNEPINIKLQNPISAIGGGNEENKKLCRLPVS